MYLAHGIQGLGWYMSTFVASGDISAGVIFVHPSKYKSGINAGYWMVITMA
jgi:hypothetical protein